MEVKAGSLLFYISRENAGAGGQSEHAVCFFHRLFYRKRTCVRSDVLGAVIAFLQYRLYAGIRLVSHPNIAVPLVVFQQDVILRRVQFYQRTFQHQRFKLAVRYDELIVVDIRYHLPHFRQMVLSAPEIRSHAVVQVLCLADIDYLAALVLHYVDTRRGGQL